MKCPVCNAFSRTNVPTCRRCGADLSPLVELVERAFFYHRRAIEAARGGNPDTALDWNRRARSLIADEPEFETLAGQLLALRGDFPGAVRAWQEALRLNPEQAIARQGLDYIHALSLGPQVHERSGEG